MSKFEHETASSTLSAAAINRRPYRISVIINKIKENSPFLTVENQSVFLHKSILPKLKIIEKLGQKNTLTINKIRDILSKGSQSIFLPLEDGKQINLTKLRKTYEFGGKSSQHYLKAEKIAKNCLEDLINEAIEESNEESLIINIIDQNNTNLMTIKNVIAVDLQEHLSNRAPKADLFLLSKDSQKTYISYKDGTSPRDFLQWSGVTSFSGIEISEHPEIKQFAEDLKNSIFVKKSKSKCTMKQKSPVYRRIIDEDLKKKAMFGKEHDKYGISSPENVDLICQGNFKLEKVEANIYNLSATHIIARRLCCRENLGTYEPIIYAKYTMGRSNLGIGKSRISIYPVGGLTGMAVEI